MYNMHYDFSPNMFHPFYIIRTGLKNAILSNSTFMSGKMLDFGCGSKPYKDQFKVDEYIGLDYENDGHTHENEQIDVFYDGQNIPFPDEYFDSVLSSEVFEHVFNIERVLTEINRVMKKEGKLLITCPFVWNEHEVPHDYARYTLFALRDLLDRHGFELVKEEKSGDFITTIFQLWSLYFYTAFSGLRKGFFLYRWFYKVFFVFCPNASSFVLEKILPNNKSLYLNNIVVAKKK